MLFCKNCSWCKKSYLFSTHNRLKGSTHGNFCFTITYISANKTVQTLDNLRPFGKLFEVRKVLPMNKASFKEVRQSWPHSEVSARNIPLSSDELRSKLGVSSGEDAHIFGARVELPFAAGNYLFVCSRI